MKHFKSMCVLLVMLISGCYRETSFEKEVVIRPGTKGYAYEIQIKGHGEGRGNPHNPFDWKVHRWNHSFWVYLNNKEGTIAANDLVLTPHWRCAESPWSYSNVKGHVEFREGKFIVALDLGRYSGTATYNRETKEWEAQDTLIGHASFEANGTYAIRLVNDSWQPATEQEARSLEAAPCKR